ncbi:MAG: hypothetical protein AAF456_18800 [Planctomycetota bacterium]
MNTIRFLLVLFLLFCVGIEPALAQTFSFNNSVPLDDRWTAVQYDDSTPPVVIATNWDSLSIPNSPSHDAEILNHHANLARVDVQLNSLTVGPQGSLLIGQNMQLFGNNPLVNEGSIVFSTRGDKSFSFSNNFVNSGTFEVDSSQSGPAALRLTNAGATLQGGGRIILSDVNASTIDGGSGLLLTIADQTIEGTGFIGMDNLEIINTANGLITANTSIGWRIVIDAGTGGFLNQGVLRAENGGTLRILDSVVDNTVGTVHSDEGSEIEFQDSTISGGSLTGAGEFSTFSGTTRFENVDFDSSLYVGANDILEIAGTLNNSGYIETHQQNGRVVVAPGGATLDGGGTISLGDQLTGAAGETLVIANQTILLSQVGNDLGSDLIEVVNLSGGVIEADDVNSTIDPFGTLPWTNDGTVRMATNRNVTLTIGQSVVNNGTMDARGGTIWVDGNSLISSVGSILTGNGTIRSNDVINVGGTVSPGNSAGELTLNGNVVFAPAAELAIELAGSGSFDVLSVTNSDPVILDGNLKVLLVNGFVPDVADTFVIVNANDTLSGTFSNVASGSRVSTADGMGSFEVNYAGSSSVVLSDFLPTTPLNADTMDVIRGVQTSGSVSTLSVSDNVDVSISRNQAIVAAVVEVEFESTTSVVNPDVLSFTIEASAFFRSELIQSVEFFDYDTGQFVEVDFRPAARFADNFTTAIGTGDVSRFVEAGTGNVKTRVLYTSTVPRQTFAANIDRVFWSID